LLHGKPQARRAGSRARNEYQCCSGKMKAEQIPMEWDEYEVCLPQRQALFIVFALNGSADAC
jgi:hypothetical protein